MVLKDFSSSQSEIREDIDNQKKNFLQLKSDMQSGSLKKNSSKKHVLVKYGDPVYCKDGNFKAGAKQYCVYRLPAPELDTELIYLYFGDRGKLVYWEIVPES